MWSFRPKGHEHTVVLLSVHPQNPLPPTFILPSQTNCLFPSGFCRMKDAILFCQFLWTLPFSPGTASKTVISRTLRKRTGGLLKTVNYNFMSMTEGQIRYTTQALMPPEQKTLDSQYTCIYWACTIKWTTKDNVFGIESNMTCSSATFLHYYSVFSSATMKYCLWMILFGCFSQQKIDWLINWSQYYAIQFNVKQVTALI